MSLLQELVKRTTKVEEELNTIAHSKCSYATDDKGILHIRFDDGHQEQVPRFPYRTYQVPVDECLFKKGRKRLLLLWSRRSGKEATSWTLLVKSAILHPGLYVIVYPTGVRGRAILWEGSLLIDGRTVKFLDMVPARFILRINHQEMKIFLTNGSILWVLGGDIDADKLRGTNIRGIVYAEFAFQKPDIYYTVLPILRQNGGWLAGQSTYDGINHFYELFNGAKNNPDWDCFEGNARTLVDEKGERYITDEMIDEDRRGNMPEWLINQEYYNQVDEQNEKYYFSGGMKSVNDNNRIVADLCLPSYPLYSFWDWGMNDACAIILAQFVSDGVNLKPHIVGYIEENNKALNDYFSKIRSFAASRNLIIRDHMIAHDGAKRDYNKKSLIDLGREAGEPCTLIERVPSKMYSIELARRLLYYTYFDRDGTVRLREGLSKYQKEYDEDKKTYREHPLHNWASHSADAYQTMSVAVDKKLIYNKPMLVGNYQI